MSREIKKLASPLFLKTYDVSSTTTSHAVLTRLYNFLLSNNGKRNDNHHHHHHRTYSTILNLLRASSLSPKIVDLSIQVFHELAKAESAMHNVPISDVHFHEVGAVDSIIDTVGVVLGLDMIVKSFSSSSSLSSTKIYASALPLCTGIVNTQHGFLPVPAPATLRLLEGFPTVPAPCNVRGELVTPTGVALLKVLCGSNVGTLLPPNFTLKKSGYGAGTKDFVTHPNIVRIMLGSCPPRIAVTEQRKGVFEISRALEYF